MVVGVDLQMPMWTWVHLARLYCQVMGLVPPASFDGDVERRDDLHFAAWAWMWGFAPGSAARAGAFLIGKAAYAVAAAKEAPDSIARLGRMTAAIGGLRAHIDDMRWRWKPLDQPADQGLPIPPGERVYTTDPAHEAEAGRRGIWCGLLREPWAIASQITADHLQRLHKPPLDGQQTTLFARLAVSPQMAGASFGPGRWTMTSADVGRFIDLILEEKEVAS